MSSFHALFSLGTGLGAASISFAVSWGVGMVPHITGAALVAGIGLVWTWRQPDGCDLIPQPERKAPLFDLPRAQLLAVALIAFFAHRSVRAATLVGAVCF